MRWAWRFGRRRWRRPWRTAVGMNDVVGDRAKRMRWCFSTVLDRAAIPRYENVIVFHQAGFAQSTLACLSRNTFQSRAKFRQASFAFWRDRHLARWGRRWWWGRQRHEWRYWTWQGIPRSKEWQVVANTKPAPVATHHLAAWALDSLVRGWPPRVTGWESTTICRKPCCR